LQFELAYLFRNRRRIWKTYAFIEQRIQISKTRFRIPDVCVYIGGEPPDRIFRTPPFICIELSASKFCRPRIASPAFNPALTTTSSSASLTSGLSIPPAVEPGLRRRMAAAKSRTMRSGPRPPH
jgi:hypothetical protein